MFFHLRKLWIAQAIGFASTKAGHRYRCTSFNLSFAMALATVVFIVAGCGATTKRIGTEQLLISDAVDNAVAKIDFSLLRGQKVYFDTKYIQSIRSNEFVDAAYVISSIRQQLTAAGCLIHESREDADSIVEARLGAMGADGHEITYGIPKTGGLSAAASALSSAPVSALPEVSFAQTNAQSGVAKVIVFAYDRETRQPIWQSGVARAESSSSSTWVLGAGPFQKGSIYEGKRFAGRKLTTPNGRKLLVNPFRSRDPSGTSATEGQLSYKDSYDFGPSFEANEMIVAEDQPDQETPVADVANATSVDSSKAKTTNR